VSAISVSAIDIQDEPDVVVLNKIQQEHAATRQFFVNEMNSKIKVFTDDFTERADYYEASYERLMNKAVIMLGLMWLGVSLFTGFFSRWLFSRAEKKKYEVLKQSIRRDLLNEMAVVRQEPPKEPQPPVVDMNLHRQSLLDAIKAKPQPQPVPPPVPLTRWQQRKLDKEQKRIDNTKKFIEEKQRKIAEAEQKMDRYKAGLR